MRKESISVIIPTLNEEDVLGATLQRVTGRPGLREIIVVDGGSVDGTRKVASPVATLIQAPTGRSLQMNAGAEAAAGDILVFLHADTLLPDNALELIQSCLSDPRTEGGCFRLKFADRRAIYRFYSLFTRLPWPLICFGDRSIFVRKKVFDEIGGFSEKSIFEDLELVRALHRRGGFRFLSSHVTTSARRFHENGALRQQAKNVGLWIMYLTGISDRSLARFYQYR